METFKKLFLIFFLIIINILFCYCGCEFSSIGENKKYDFTPAFSGEYISTSDGTNTVFLNLCTTIQISKCPSTSACIKDSTKNTDLGQQVGPAIFLPKGILLTYKSQAYPECVNLGGFVSTNFTIECDSTNNSFTLDKIQQFSICNYGIKFLTKLACVCPGDCSSHGICNTNTIKCQCNSYAGGSSCNELKMIISTISSTTIYGGNVTITGDFSNLPLEIKSNLKIKINWDDCKNVITNINNNNTIQCTIDKGYNGDGIEVEFTSGPLSTVMPVNFKYIEIPCPFNCSYPNGQCNKILGTCTCSHSWVNGTGCELLKSKTYSIEPTTINGGITNIIGDFTMIINGTTFLPNNLIIKIGDDNGGGGGGGDSSPCQDIKILNDTNLQCYVIPGKQGKKNLTISSGLSIDFNYQLFEYFNNTCLYNCSYPHGDCNLFTSYCSCDSQTNGTGCENSKLEIESIDPTDEPGGLTNVFGFFGIPTSNFSIKIGDLLCDNLNIINQSVIQCNVPPGKGFKNVFISDRDLSFNGELIFRYFQPIVTNAPKQCTNCGAINQGYCASQGCICHPPWMGVDCQSQYIIIPQPPKNSTSPSVEMPTFSKPNSTNNNGGTGGSTTSTDIDENENIEKNVFKSLIAIVKLSELDFQSNEVKSFTFSEWIYKELTPSKYQYNTTIKVPTTNDTGEVSPSSSSSLLNESETIISVTLEWFESLTNITFANENLIMNPSSIKYTIEISKYKFSSKLNQLQLVMMAELSSNKTKDLCSNNEFGETSSGDNSNYIKIQVDNHSLYGRFIKRAIIDSVPRAIGNVQLDETMKPLKNASSSQSYIGIVVPYFEKSIIIDPDFSVLIDSSKLKESNSNSICLIQDQLISGLTKSQIAGIIIGSIAFLCSITAMIIYSIHKSNKDKSLFSKITLRNLNK
ncbi:hypothetical protein ACTFIY_004431 [Dictyostelium cf. discoideum]